MKKLLIVLFFMTTTACAAESGQTIRDEIITETNILFDYPAIHAPGQINVLIEIPAGTLQKWEAKKSGEGLDWDRKDGKLRIVNYLPYPDNYGMVPRTLLPREAGGDGDPLDVIVLGAASERASVIPARPIGVLRLLDDGEQDDKIIAVPLDGPLSEVTSLQQLETNYAGITTIIELWFTNYKGPGHMTSQGYADADAAWEMITISSAAFEAQQKK